MQEDDTTTRDDSRPEYVQRGSRYGRDHQEVEISSAEVLEKTPNESSLDRVIIVDYKNRSSELSEMKDRISR